MNGQDAWLELLDGSLDAWTIEHTAFDNFRIVDGVLRVEAPEGWLRSNHRFRDFELDVEFRFLTDDADSGIFVRAAGSAPFRRGWPDASYQVQMRNPLGPSPFAPIGGLFRHGMPDDDTRYDEALARTLSRPTGEWQRIFVRARDAELGAELNGQPVLAARIVATDGYVGLQGETGALDFRSFRIRSL